MATIKTMDGVDHKVKETREEVYGIINSQECLAVGVVPLTLKCTITNFSKSDEGELETVYEPVSFMKHGIMMYY